MQSFDWRTRVAAARSRFGPPLAVAALLFVLPLLFLAPVTLGGRTLVPFDALLSDPVYAPLLEARGIETPSNALLADMVFQNLSWKSYLAGAVDDAEVPLWNAHVLGGLPFLASGQHSALYPPTVLFLLMAPERAFGWNALLAMWLAGLTMYGLGRTLRLGRFAALVMGTVWSLGLLFVANTVFPMIQGVLVWAPMILAAIEATAGSAASGHAEHLLPRGRATVWLIALAVATTLAALAGHIEMLYYTALLAGAFAVFRIVGVARGNGRPAAAHLGLWYLGAAVTGALLAGVQLVPLAELARVNWRGGSEPYDVIAGYAFGLRQAVTFLVPDFYGNPAHHGVWDIVRTRRVALDDHAMWGTAWGTKNYVEAAAYAGVLPLVFALVGLIAARRRPITWFFAAVAAVSLTFVFGLPTYRLLFLGLPGFDQLHTPFRWVYPLVFSLVVLAGLGADRLAARRPAEPATTWIGVGATAGGLLLATALWLAFQLPRRWVALVEGLFSHADGSLDAALERFPDIAAFASYQYWAGAHLAVFLTLSGVTVLALARAATRPRWRRWAMALAMVVTVADLWLVGFGFNPAGDRSLASVKPDTVEWLSDATEAKWGRVVGFGAAKALWPNTGMREGIYDLRGYESIIPEWTVETLNAIDGQPGPLDDPAGRHGMLTYNRFGNLTDPAALGHPGLAALGGRYVVSPEALDVPGLELVHEGEARVYENTGAMPRAWLVNQVQVVEDRGQLLAALAEFDPATEVLLEDEPSLDIWQSLRPGRQIRRTAIRVRDDVETRNSMEIEVVGAPSGGMLVLSEGWFPGWRAWVEVAGADEPEEVPIYRANGSLRAIPVPPGLSTVRLKYFPMSVKVGLYATFLGVILLLLAAAYALWDRFVHVERDDAMGLVAVNSAGPMAASLLNKVVDFVFAMLMLRVLGSENAGNYYFAISVIGFAEIFSNFGLNLLTAREVAKRPEAAPRYLTHTSLIRIALWALTLPLLAGYVGFERATGHPVGTETALALALFALALLPSNLNAAITSVFQGLERMVLPAGVSIVSTLVKVSLGALVLLAGYGFVGLAGVSIVTNTVTLLILAAVAAREGIRPALGVSAGAMWAMMTVSLPLMLNHLLQTVFFRIDVLLLRRLEGAVVVGWYSTAYKWVDALLIIPPAVTMALFPLLSRRASEDREGMARTYTRALRFLLMLALPIAVATTFTADLLVGLLGGRDYLPHGAQALQIMIWFLPLSFANGLTQYVLIALNRQRWITISFAVAATFNIVANLVVIPRYSYSGAAFVTILSEIVLMAPFLWGLRDVPKPPFLVVLWRPAMATSLMALVLGISDSTGMPLVVGLPLAAAAYLGALLQLGAVTRDDRALLARVLPGPWRDAPPAPRATVDGANSE